jgi:hypothetical protein
MIQRTDRRFAICLGINGRRARGNARDQLAILIDARGVVGVARKFYAAPGETIDAPEHWHDGDGSYERIVRVHGKTYFIAVCYDVFAIRHRTLPRPVVDAVLTLVHGFSPVGEGNSGDVLFARHGLAGAASAWRVPVFASATFFCRPVPLGWPSGVRWKGRAFSTTRWRYDDNGLSPTASWDVETPAGRALVREFEIR